jgi:Ca-activated chloride channel family protein
MAFAAPPAFATRDTERYPGAAQNPVRRVAEEPVSTFSIDVDTAAYANVRRYLRDGKLPPRDAVRVEEMINYFDYGYRAPQSAGQPFAVTTALVPSPWSGRRRILHVGLQGYDIPRNAQPPMNLVLLMDTSGSMSPEDRLPLARKAVDLLVQQLRPQDRLAIVAYAGSAGAVLSPTAGNEKLKIRCAMETLQSGGSTAGGAGLSLAYALGEQNFRKDAVNRIILMTDGDFNVGISDPARLKDFVADKRKSGIYLSVYGFGRGNYQDVMMQALAQQGNGTAAYIDTLDEARKLFRDDLSGSIFPIADDVKIQIEFNPALVSEYRLIGYETRALRREDFNNDKVDAGEVGSRASVTALYELTMAGDPPSSDPLRYVANERPARPERGRELGYLKLRYKLPGQAESRLMQQPIAATDTARSAAAAPEATRWALAVAAFGEKLRASPWVDSKFDWNSIATLAQDARGADTYGLRAEFLRLVRSAGDASNNIRTP